MLFVKVGGGGGVRVRSGPSSQFNFCFGRCNHLSPRGYRCKDCDLEGGKWRQNLEEDVVAKWRAIRRSTWREGALKPCPGNRARLSPAML